MMPKFFSVIITIIIPLFLMPYATPGQSMQLVHLSGQAGLFANFFSRCTPFGGIWSRVCKHNDAAFTTF